MNKPIYPKGYNADGTINWKLMEQMHREPMFECPFMKAAKALLEQAKLIEEIKKTF